MCLNILCCLCTIFNLIKILVLFLFTFYIKNANKKFQRAASAFLKIANQDAQGIRLKATSRNFKGTVHQLLHKHIMLMHLIWIWRWLADFSAAWKNMLFRRFFWNSSGSGIHLRVLRPWCCWTAKRNAAQVWGGWLTGFSLKTGSTMKLILRTYGVLYSYRGGKCSSFIQLWGFKEKFCTNIGSRVKSM